MASTVKDRDRGYAALMKRIRAAQGKPIVTVGIHEAEGGASHGEDDLSVAELGEIHEYGLGVPERSFIRAWADENQQEHEGQLRKIGEAVVKGTVPSIEQGLERFGLLAVGQIQQRIADGIEPELAASTIAAKGSSTPLVDTGVLRSSITSKVSK